MVESLVELTSLEQLWSCLGAQENKEKLTLLHFVLSRVNVGSKYGSESDDVMKLAAKSVGSTIQQESSNKLVKEIINERNLLFLETTFLHLASQLLSSNTAVLREAFTSETTNLENTSVLLVLCVCVCAHVCVCV